MRATWVLLAGLLLAGCGGSSTTPEPAADATTEAPPPEATTGTAAEVEATPAEAPPSPATREEIAAVCKTYRKALRSRWDDARTRREVGTLELHSGAARSWQRDLTSGDVDVALRASREVVTAATAADLTAECEPLANLVSLSEAMQAAPGTLQH